MTAPAGRFASWSLRRRVGASFVTTFGLYLLLSATVLVSLIVFRSKGDDVIDKWQPAFAFSVYALDDMVNQETAVRGFALSHQEHSLDPYREYLAKFTTDTRALHGYIEDDAGLVRDYDALIAAATHWHDVYARAFITRIRANDPAVAAAVGGDAAKNAFDDIRSTATTLSDHLRTIREQYKADRRTAGNLVWYFFAGAVVLVLAIGVLLWRGLQRSILAPIESLASQTRALAGGNIGERIVSSGPPEIEGLGEDVNAMRARIANELVRVETARLELMARTEDLARSNADLEQFAYVASHDLSEPLRKVANFCQLLERQYGDQLDDKARRYIDFAVDGAKRMQVLIADLLSFSRVGRTTEEFVPVDLNDVVARATANLEQRIADAGARIEHGDLPTIAGDPSLLTALFQNLIGNSVKYRGDEPPVVRLTAEPRPDYWLFSISDNGIGIEPRYADRIFAIFQRLHLRDQYGGTGIGLALCRKITEFHGGRIWLDETVREPGEAGATFHFTLANDGSGRHADFGQKVPDE